MGDKCGKNEFLGLKNQENSGKITKNGRKIT
jgi:hypothetical protein